MDFELSIWEMTSLLISPKKVFRSIYYHKQTHSRFHRGDPSFTYLLSLFLFLTGLAWGIAYTNSVGATIRLTLIFVFVHFLLGSLVVATVMWVGLERLLGPRGVVTKRGLGLGRGKRRGLFPAQEEERGEGGVEGVEFGYCFDVSARPRDW